MTHEMNRRQFAQISAGSAFLLSAFGFNVAAFAQDQTANASAVVTVTDGPGEDELTVVHAQGETTIKKNPGKIVSFDITSIQSIEFLGGSIAGAPVLASGGEFMTSDAEPVGSLFEPDYEAVNAIAPDLIIVAGRSAAVYSDLAKIAPTIDLSFGKNMMQSFAEISTALGHIIGAEDAASAAITEIEERVAVLQDAASDAGTGLVIMVSGGSVTALAPGNAQGGRGALVYDVLGIRPPIEELETATHGEPISFEFLLEHNPDWLFVIDRDAAVGDEGQSAEQVLDNDIMHETVAYQSGHIVYVNSFDWYIISGASIPSFGRMLDEMDTAFGI